MTTSPLSISCTAIFNGLMISGQPGRHDWSNKVAKYYTALALAVLLRVYVILYTTNFLVENVFIYLFDNEPQRILKMGSLTLLKRRLLDGMLRPSSSTSRISSQSLVLLSSEEVLKLQESRSLLPPEKHPLKCLCFSQWRCGRGKGGGGGGGNCGPKNRGAKI